MAVLGEDSDEIDYTQFCLLLNDKAASDSNNFSVLLKNGQMRNAVDFFDQLKDYESDFTNAFEDIPNSSKDKITAKV